MITIKMFPRPLARLDDSEESSIVLEALSWNTCDGRVSIRHDKTVPRIRPRTGNDWRSTPCSMRLILATGSSSEEAHAVHAMHYSTSVIITNLHFSTLRVTRTVDLALKGMILSQRYLRVIDSCWPRAVADVTGIARAHIAQDHH